MSVKLNLLRKLVRELIKRELEEATMTGNIDGGAGPPKTPKAFKKKKKGQDESGFQDGHVDPTVSTSYRKVKESINEAVKGLKGYQKYVDKKKGEVLFYAESPDSEVYMGLEKTKNGKFDLTFGTMGMISPSGGVMSALDGPDEYSSLSQAKAGIKDQMAFAKQGYAHPDEKKFSWKVVVDKLNESVNESRVSVAKEGKLEPFAKAAIKQLQNLISFHKKGKNEKARQMSRDVYTELEYMGMAFKVLGESININGKKYKPLNENNQSWAKYYSWRNDKSMTPKQKIGMSMREVRDSLQELEKIVFRSIKLKKELKVGSDNYWKSTHSALRRIHERLVKLTGKIANLY